MLSHEELLAKLISRDGLDIYIHRLTDDKFPTYFHRPHGIHGILHAKRVLLLSQALSYLCNLNKADTAILATAALYHDIGRTHDGVCSVHGGNSVRKAQKLGLIAGDADEENEILRYVIVNHSIRDGLVESVDNYAINDQARAVRLMKYFKDSDGLDRVRIRDLDVNYLRYPASRELVAFAWYLLREIKD